MVGNRNLKLVTERLRPLSTTYVYSPNIFFCWNYASRIVKIAQLCLPEFSPTALLIAFIYMLRGLEADRSMGS